MTQEKSRSPPQHNTDHKPPFQTVSFLSIVFLIDRKKQSTRGMGSVAPHITTTFKERKEVKLYGT